MTNRHTVLPVVALMFALVVTGCSWGNAPETTDTASDSPNAQVTESTQPSSDTRPADGVTPEDAMQESYTHVVNVDASTMAWGGQKITGSGHQGTVAIEEGGIVVDENENITGGVFVIDMSTIQATDTDSAALHTHLKGEDFFDVEQYPEARFEIESVDFTGDNQANVTGALTIKDVTKTISFPATITKANDDFVAQAEFTIDRTEWNVRYGSGKFFEGLADNTIEDEMTFTLDLVATPVEK